MNFVSVLYIRKIKCEQRENIRYKKNLMGFNYHTHNHTLTKVTQFKIKKYYFASRKNIWLKCIWSTNIHPLRVVSRKRHLLLTMFFNKKWYTLKKFSGKGYPEKNFWVFFYQLVTNYHIWAKNLKKIVFGRMRKLYLNKILIFYIWDRTLT
jgi:hypothetical protein